MGNRAVVAVLQRSPNDGDDDFDEPGGLVLDFQGDEVTPEDRERDEELLGDLRLGPGLGWSEWSIWNVEWPMEPPPATPGRLMVKPEVAFKMLENLAAGLPPFRPDLGKGGCSWFTTEGAPHVGIDATKNIPVEVQLTRGSDWMVLREAELRQLFQRFMTEVQAEAEAKFRQLKGIPEGQSFNSRLRKEFARFHKRFAESRMWDRVGQVVQLSDAKAAEVILEPGSDFSKTPGRFAVIADRSLIRLRGGPAPLVKALAAAGFRVARGLLEAIKQAMLRIHPELELVEVIRVGGRLLILAAVVADVFKILYADDKLKATIQTLAGWATATMFAETFAWWWAPADVAGPEAWVVHVVGTLASGGIGYFVGSWYAGELYEIAIE